MKTKSFIAMSMVAALAAGCSSDDIVGGEDNNNGTNTSGKAFVALNIMLPSTNGTRSVNDKFDQGTPNEYKVNSVKVTYYSKEDGKTVVDTKTYKAGDLAWDTPSTPANGITTKAILPVEEVDFSGDALVLVEVNTPVGLTVSPDNAVQTTTAEKLIGGATKDGFFMTNTVNADGTSLVNVKSYGTKLEAQANANRQNIYVERAVAKVDLNVASTGWTDNVYEIPAGETNAGAKIEIAKWQLDVTNNVMFPIRKFAGKGKFDTGYGRFYGVETYRTYWAEDPNYSANGAAGDFNIITADASITNNVGSFEYCLENTFNTEHQKQSQTTRALVKAVYTPAGKTPGKTWYTLGGGTTAYSTDEVVAAIATTLGKSVSEIALIEAAIPAGESEFNDTRFTVNSAIPSSEQVTAVQNTLGKIHAYKNGICYYAIRIKHLDNYCPWGGELNAYETGGTAYVDYTTGTDEMEQHYLGRYGVVRNNWYQITISTVSQPGTPTIPELPDTPDDEQKYYLQATINILDWAVRTQSVDL